MIEVSKPLVYLVYVHLGQNPAPTLQKFAENISGLFPESQCILVTDQPKNWTLFPGVVLDYKRDKRQTGIKKFLSNHREYEEISSGYWLFTLERFFALERVRDYIKSDIPIIHLESDVAIYLSESILNSISSKLKRTSLPRFSSDYGVGSCVYFPDSEHIKDFIELINTELHAEKAIENDMQLLGCLLNKELVDELPSGRMTNSEIQINLGEYHLIFDGAALGQYLLGQDPLHTGNRRISGYRNPSFPTVLSDEVWEIVENDNKEFLSYRAGEQKKLVVALHVHAKVPLTKISSADIAWARMIKEANHVVEREWGDLTPDLIHSQKISVTNRVRIAKRHGLVKTIIRKVSRLV
jgi:hypothetical protein